MLSVSPVREDGPSDFITLYVARARSGQKEVPVCLPHSEPIIGGLAIFEHLWTTFVK